MSAAVIAIIAAQQAQQRRIYSIVANGIFDIDEITNTLRSNRKYIISVLNSMIKTADRSSNSKNRQWNVLAGAYLDFPGNRIVLAAPITGLVHSISDYNMASVWVLRIFGYLLGLFGLFMLMGFIAARDEPILIIVPLTTICLAALLLFWGEYIKNIMTIGKQYTELISEQNITSIEQIAHITRRSVKHVRKDPQTMINQMIFVNAIIDTTTDEIIINCQPN